MIERIRMGVKMAASVVKQASLRSGIGFAGRWNFVCHRYVSVSDPERVLHEANQVGLYLPGNGTMLLNEGRMYPRDASDLLAPMGKLLRREVERLLSGGGVRWRDEGPNLVVDEGLDHILDTQLSGGTQDTTWFVGLLASGPTPLVGWVAATMASEDFVDYGASNLIAFVDGGVTGQSVHNQASPAAFDIDTNSSTIGGGFLITDDAKATPAGTLFAAKAFTLGDKPADSGDTLNVDATFDSSAV